MESLFCFTVSVSEFPEYVDSILTSRDIYKHVLGLQQKTEKYEKTVFGKISLILKIMFLITASCCLFHNGLSWEKHQKGEKKSHRPLMSSIAAKNALILVIRNFTKHNKMDYHQRNLVLKKHADYKGRCSLYIRGA